LEYGLEKKVNVRYKAFKSLEEVEKSPYKPKEFSTTKNISAGGLLFISDKGVGVGSIIELTIDLPEDPAINCLARVVRVEETAVSTFEIAVCFLDISSEERVVLNKFVQQELA